MCKFCNVTDDFDQEFMAEIDYEFGNCSTALEVIIVEDACGPALGITVGDFVDASVSINFCPVCGRKLRKI